MTLNELKGRYARLSAEIDSFGSDGQPNEAKLARLMFELDRVDDELAAYRRRAVAAPTLSEVIALDSLDLYLDLDPHHHQQAAAHA
jgi:hypothetical protein